MLSAIGVITGGLLLRILLESLGLAFFWPQDGATHSCGVMMSEWQWLFEKMKNLPWLLHLPLNVMMWMSRLANSCSRLIGRWMHDASPHAVNALLGTYACSICDICIRLMQFLSGIPAVLICVAIGVTDGLVKRDLKRFGIGHESGFLHHRIRHDLRKILVTMALVYLALPYPIPGEWFVLPIFVLSVGGFHIMASFKKYM